MADATWLSIEAVADEADLTSGNSQMAPVVTSGTIKADTATFTNWPPPGRTRSARYDATGAASGACYSSVTPSGAAGGWQELIPFRFGAYPASTMTFTQFRGSGIAADLRMSSTGVISVHNSAGTAIHSFAAINPGAYWIGFYVGAPSSTAGAITVTIWDAQGVQVATFSTTTANTGTTALVSLRVGSKINSGTAIWTCWVGPLEVNYTSETGLTLAPPPMAPTLHSPLPEGVVGRRYLIDDIIDSLPVGPLVITSVPAGVVQDATHMFLPSTETGSTTVTFTDSGTGDSVDAVFDTSGIAGGMQILLRVGGEYI